MGIKLFYAQLGGKEDDASGVPLFVATKNELRQSGDFGVGA